MCVSRRLVSSRAVVHGVVVAQARLSPDRSPLRRKTEAARGVNEAGGHLSRSHPNGG